MYICITKKSTLTLFLNFYIPGLNFVYQIVYVSADQIFVFRIKLVKKY